MLKTDLINVEKWNDYYNRKKEKDFITKKEKKFLLDYIENKNYMEISSKIINDEYTFSIPKKHIINKGGSKKKRLVYTFNNDEMIILKFISYLLYEYDFLFTPNLYSFRKNSSVKKAITNISSIKNINNMYGYKVDIQNYFNKKVYRLWSWCI